METRSHNSLQEIDSAAWNRMVADNFPFMRHEFLLALEQNGCTGPTYGWLPRHIAVYDNDTLVGAVANYEKDNTYGEFVFDHIWADAYHRHGLPYFPKQVIAAPYTPAQGPRILTTPGYNRDEISDSLIEKLLSENNTRDISSIHFLFTTEQEKDYLAQQGWQTRTGYQFHWHNQDYRDFDDFLETLTAKKRKNIRQERHYAAQADLEIEIIQGNQATTEQLKAAEFFYRKTFDEKWGTPTLSLGFFEQIAHTMGEQLLLIMARREQEYIAGAILFQSDTTLYGRHWGCIEEHHCLHFELCYYQGIEYAIRQGLQVFEPGAQGEHKISRGFLPTPTWSSHWIKHPDFRQAIAQFLNQETRAIDQQIEVLQQHSPYK